MRIGIIGAGRLGEALGRLLTRAGHHVRLANSRGPATLKPLVEALGPRASAGTPAEVAAFGDVIILAVRWGEIEAAISALGDLAGRIVVDPTNNRVGPRPEDVVDLGGRASSEVVREMLPGARLVKAFNHQPIAALVSLPDWPADAERPAFFLAGDDPAAKAVVAQLIRDIGGAPVDTGNLAVGGRLQATGTGPLAGLGRLLPLTEARALLARATGAHGQGAD